MRVILLTCLLLPLARSVPAQEYLFQTGHTHDILTVKFSPDDRQLASYSAGDGRLCLWDVGSGRLLWMTKTEFVQKADEYYTLREFNWSKDGRTFVTKSENGTYQVWDVNTGKILSVSDSPPEIELRAEGPKKLSVTKDYENFYLSGPDAGSRYTIKSFSRTGSAYDVSHDGTLFAEGGSWGDAAIKVTEVITGRSRFLDGHPSIVKSIAYSPDGSYLAVAGSDKNIYIFDAAKRVLARVLVGHTKPVSAIAFSPDGKILLSSAEYELMKVWDWREGRLVRNVESPEDIFGVQKVTFSPDGNYFLTTSDRDEFRLWDSRTWTLVRTFKTPERYESGGVVARIVYDAVPVTGAAFSRDGRRVYSSHADGTLRTWDLNRGRQLARLKLGKAVSFVRLTPDGEMILAAVGEHGEIQFKLFDAGSGGVVSAFDKEDTGYTEALTLSPDGRHFASSDVSGAVLLWGIGRRKPLHTLNVGFSGDDALAFSPDGKTLAVGGRNQNLFLFDVASGAKLWQLIPSYRANELELKLSEEKEHRQDRLNEQKAQRDRQAAVDAEIYRRQVYITFEHYGDMTDPGEQRMVESGEPNMNKVKKRAAEANAVWLRLHNDSPLPIKIPTQSMYLPNPKCFFQFPDGQKVLGLCDGREISVWFGLESKDGKPLPYGFDFGSSAILLPKTSALFPVPLEILRDGNAIRFQYSFQKDDGGDKVGDYGKEIALRFRGSELPDR
jgi:WD40 repeat protein